MIERLRLTNFKCFESLDIEFGGLTILAGLNGSGKSSVLHSLLLLKQSITGAAGTIEELRTLSSMLELGSGRDVLFDQAPADEVGIEVFTSGEGRSMNFVFVLEQRSRMLRLDRGRSSIKAIAKFRETLDALWFLSADRLGPTKLQAVATDQSLRPRIGTRGEHAFHFLEEHGSDVLEATDPRVIDDSQFLISRQLDAWLSHISHGVHFSVENVELADGVLGMFRFDQPSDIKSRQYRPANVGFGLSYTLPVVLLMLMARAGDILLIENPEAHVHPAGQVRLAELAARASKAGIQVVIETHSDHVLNGVRLAVKDRLLTSNSVKLHYFSRLGSTSSAVSPQVLDDGRLSDWPSGFFDQHEINLIRLLSSDTKGT